MHNTYTSGAARRNALDDARKLYGPTATGLYINAVNAVHEATGRINPILDGFRDDGYPGDPDLSIVAGEYLFQLGRHWSEWQSPRIGTFPHDMRDHFGPVTQEESEESGEDRVYWYIAEAIVPYADDDAGNRVQDYIVHATAVIGRLYSIAGGDDE